MVDEIGGGKKNENLEQEPAEQESETFEEVESGLEVEVSRLGQEAKRSLSEEKSVVNNDSLSEDIEDMEKITDVTREGIKQAEEVFEVEIDEISNTENSRNREVTFCDKNGKELNISPEDKEVADRVKVVVDEENKYYSQFFDNNVTDQIILGDDFFASNNEKTIEVPFQNLEDLKETKVIVRHESLHRALRAEDVNGIDLKNKICENLKNGEDIEISFIGKINTAQFKEFAGDNKEDKQFLGAAELSLGKMISGNMEEKIEEIIEESLADEMMLKREKEVNPESAVENVTKAKIIALNSVAKNKGVENYKKIDSLKMAGFKGFVGNYYNTLKFLSRINAESGKESLAMEFESLTDSAKEQLKKKIVENFTKDGYGEKFKKLYGYDADGLINDLDSFLNKCQNLIKE